MFRIGLSDMTLILICHQEVQRASRLSIPDYESSVFSTKKTFKSFNSQHSIPNIRYIGINLFVMESYLWTQYHFFSCSSLNFRSRGKNRYTHYSFHIGCGPDKFSDCHHDLALLLVGFHVLVGLDYFLQRKGAINDRFQRAGLEAVADIRLAAGQLFRVLCDLEQSITP